MNKDKPDTLLDIEHDFLQQVQEKPKLKVANFSPKITVTSIFKKRKFMKKKIKVYKYFKCNLKSRRELQEKFYKELPRNIIKVASKDKRVER